MRRNSETNNQEKQRKRTKDREDEEMRIGQARRDEKSLL